MNSWDDLSIREKAEMMKVAIKNGITSLPDIKNAYNEFAEGGNLYSDGSYLSKAKGLIKRHEGWRSTPYKDAPKGKSWRSVGYGFNDSGFYEKYPEGISKHYEKGITKAQAEQELDYYLGKAERTLRGIYGKHWDSFNDNQKAAIFDTYYQRPASVGKGSAFYNAVKSGRDASKYLGVSGYAGRNKDRQSVFGGGAIPAISENVEVTLPQEMPSQPMSAATPDFIPMNPQVFGMQIPSYQSPVVVPEQPIIAMAKQPTPTPEQLERQRIMQERAEQRDALNRFGLLMSMSNPQQGNDMMGAIGMLAGLGGNGIVTAYSGGGKIDKSKTWTLEDEANYRQWRASLPFNLRNTDDALYDMRGAYKAGMQPVLESDGFYHLGSRDPQTGRILKSPIHPTFLQALDADAKMGYYPIVDDKGQVYTKTWTDNEYAHGGSIYIKPSHRGRFTRLKERTGHSASWFKEHGTPAQKKMAIFELNSRHWNNHALGGYLEGAIYDLPEEEIQRLINSGYEIEYL